MTIFDTLRYPISIPPTVEELEALPWDLYIHWLEVEHKSSAIERATVHRILKEIFTEQPDSQVARNMLKSLTTLRKMIAEWNEDEHTGDTTVSD